MVWTPGVPARTVCQNAVGPVPMMRAVSQLTYPYEVPTVVSLNAIMVDGTGMCGGCRVTVGGKTHYACVDGPEFDGHQVDFGMLADRLTTYRSFEKAAVDKRAFPVVCVTVKAEPEERAIAARRDHALGGPPASSFHAAA